MYTPRGRGRAARPPRRTSRLASAATWPASLGAARPWRSGGVGTPSACELLDQALDPGRVGLGVDAVDRRHPLALEQLRDLLVGEDHQPLDQAVGLGLGDARGRRSRCRRRRSGTRARTTRRRGWSCRAARRAPPPPRGPARAARRRPRAAAAAAGEDRGRAGRSRGARRSGCGCGRSAPRRGLPPRAELDLGRHRQPLDPRRQAAGVARSARAAASARPRPAT